MSAGGGWIFASDSKAEAVASIVDADYGPLETLDYALIGNLLWTLQHERRKQDEGGDTGLAQIVLYRLRRCGDTWGFQAVTENAAPTELSCPKRLLDASTDTSIPALRWRTACRAAQARRTATRHRRPQAAA